MSIVREVLQYSISDIARMGYSFICTKLFFKGAKLVRRPIVVRGKKAFKFGYGLSTGRNCRIEIFDNGEIIMGDRCQIGDNCHLVASGRLRIGNDCLFASKVFVSDTSHGSYGIHGSTPDSEPVARPLIAEEVQIGDKVWLGENVVVLPGVSIGDGCVVGANSTVSRSLPASTISVGSPARPIKYFDESSGCWEKL